MKAGLAMSLSPPYLGAMSVLPPMVNPRAAMSDFAAEKRDQVLQKMEALVHDPDARVNVLREIEGGEQVFLTAPEPVSAPGAVLWDIKEGGIAVA